MTLHNLGTLRPSAGELTEEPRPVEAPTDSAGLPRLVLFGVEWQRLRQRWCAARRSDQDGGKCDR